MAYPACVPHAFKIIAADFSPAAFRVAIERWKHARSRSRLYNHFFLADGFAPGLAAGFVAAGGA